MDNSYFQSTEFKRSSRNAADTGVKFVVKWLVAFGIGTIKFIQSMFRMMIGK